MVTSLALYLALLALVGVERLNELRLSKRNAAVAFARGGREEGAGHYAAMTALHSLFLLACAVEPWALSRPFPGLVGWASLALVALAQALRAWAIASLGERWNTRVIVVDGLEPVTRGPYRWLKHPNYVAVVVELAALPMVHGAWWTAVAFSLANAALLYVRIRVEERALGATWAQAFAGRPRFVPGTRGG